MTIVWCLLSGIAGVLVGAIAMFIFYHDVKKQISEAVSEVIEKK